MKYYSITKGNHFYNAWPILIFIIGLFLVPIYFAISYSFIDLYLFINYSIILFSIFFIPQVIIHLNYFSHNKGITIGIDFEHELIHVIQSDKNSFYAEFKNISKVVQLRTFNNASKRIEVLPWGSYNFSVLHFKDGKKLIVTSLLIKDLEIPNHIRNYKLIKSIYPLIISPYLR